MGPSREADAGEGVPGGAASRDIAIVRTDRLIALALAAAVLLVFAPAVTHDFIAYDDPGYVTKNPRVADGLTLRGIAWAFTTTAESHYWEPLAWISHMTDVQIFGMRAGGHHATSVLLHALNAALLFLALRRLSGSRWASALVAALFALHPLHVESVAWIAERKDLLGAFFWMGTMLAYAGYARRPGAGRYAAVLGLFALGLMSKPMVVTLPVVLLLLDVWPLGRVTLAGEGDARASWGRVLLEKVPFLALSGACGAATVGLAPAGAVVPIEALGPAVRIGNALVALAVYLWKTIVPSGLAVFYPHPGAPPARSLAVAIALIATITVVALTQARRRPWLLVGWLWFLVTLLPVIGLVQVGSQSRADRYTYLALVGPFVAAAWSLQEAAARGPLARRAAVTTSAIVLALCAIATEVQLAHWRNSTTLFTHALAVTEDNFVAHTILGTELAAAGKPDDAAAHYREALRIEPDYPVAHFDLGQVLAGQGRLEDAAVHFRSALAGQPGNTQARVNLAYALNRLGRPAEAAEECEKAIQYDPTSVLAFNNLAWIRATSADASVRDGAEAVRSALRAVELDGGRSARYLATLAASFAEAGRFADAVATIDRAGALARSAGNEAAWREYAMQRTLYAQGLPLRMPSAPASSR